MNQLVKLEYYRPSDTFGIDSEHEVLIPYHPFHSAERWLSHRFSVWNSWRAWFATILMVLFFVLGGPGAIVDLTHTLFGYSAGSGAIGAGSGAVSGLLSTSTISSVATTLGGAAAAAPVESISSILVLQLMALFSAGVAGIAGYSYMKRPTHLALSNRGIAWEWRRSALSSGCLIPWGTIQAIDLLWPEGKTSPLDCIIRIRTEDQKTPMELKLGGLSTNEDRQKFLDSLERWAPHVAKDAQLVEMLATPQDQSYTELWLKALSAPPERERLTPLMANTSLQEGKYEVFGQLGVGGQGTAYEGKQNDGEDIVLKEFILPVYVDINVRKQALERMQNEVRMLKALDHEKIVKLKDFFVEDHRGYLVLEKIDGRSLRMLVDAEGKMEEDRVLDMAHQMCHMLEYLHGLSPPIVHRDFTPDNLILRKDGMLKLVDFNVAQQKEHTVTSTVVGKQSYLPPEQFRGKPTPQSDIYAMGATIFFLLTGEDPEPITMSYPKQTIDTVSDQLDMLVAKATSLDPALRYADIQELREDLVAIAPERESWD